MFYSSALSAAGIEPGGLLTGTRTPVCVRPASFLETFPPAKVPFSSKSPAFLYLLYLF